MRAWDDRETVEGHFCFTVATGDLLLPAQPLHTGHLLGTHRESGNGNTWEVGFGVDRASSGDPLIRPTSSLSQAHQLAVEAGIPFLGSLPATPTVKHDCHHVHS